jgi:hypothetical protein
LWPNGPITALYSDGDNLYIAGEFNRIGGIKCYGTVIYDASGVLSARQLSISPDFPIVQTGVGFPTDIEDIITWR